MASVPKRKRKTESGEIIREVKIGDTWKVDNRKPSLNEWVRLVIIVLTSFGFFKGGEVAYNKIDSNDVATFSRSISKSVDWTQNADKVLKERKLTMQDVARHIDPSSKQHIDEHPSMYEISNNFASKGDIVIIKKQQKEILLTLTELKISTRVLSQTIKNLKIYSINNREK